jgi:hypothetical protein
VITVDEARARGIALSSDALVAADQVAEAEAWLAARIGPLDGDRTETFYVGVGTTRGTLGLRRTADTVVLTDGDAPVDADTYRLIHDGSAVELVYSAPSWIWRGPYVTARYTPNDEDLVRRALFGILAIDLQLPSGNDSETIGAYSYSRSSAGSPLQAKAIIASEILPKRDPLYVYCVSRSLGYGDPVINRAELPA